MMYAIQPRNNQGFSWGARQTTRRAGATSPQQHLAKSIDSMIPAYILHLNISSLIFNSRPFSSIDLPPRSWSFH